MANHAQSHIVRVANLVEITLVTILAVVSVALTCSHSVTHALHMRRAGGEWGYSLIPRPPLLIVTDRVSMRLVGVGTWLR